MILEISMQVKYTNILP